MSDNTNPALPAYATTLGAAVTEAYLLAADPPPGRSPVAPAGWTKSSTLVSGYLRLSHVWENFGLWYQNNDDATQWLLALRGTSTKADGEADADTDPTVDFVGYAPAITPLPTPKVHPGFFNLYTDTQSGVSTPSMQQQLFAFLEPLVSAGKLSTLYISGHSLGGALAELFSFDVALTQWSAVTPLTVTFAAPMVGIADNWGSAYASMVKSSYAVVNQYDVVPTQPNLPGWGTVGITFSLLFYHNQNDSSEAEIVTRHSMSNYLFVLSQALGQPAQEWAGNFSDSVYVGNIDTSQYPTQGNIVQAQKSRPAHVGPVIAP